MFEGIIYRYHCRIAWRELPDVFGPRQTVGHGITPWRSRRLRQGYR
ncbi:MAG: hypothetical protein B7X32_15690 [Microbacterium sp. 13-71-7]|jgi:hypothetical protein|nr:MAG: hypothetical protein B7X32_15690 [Microbacterium sp. 13-71-7]